MVCMTYGVFSFTSLNTRSMRFLRFAYRAVPRSVFRSCSTKSRYSDHIYGAAPSSALFCSPRILHDADNCGIRTCASVYSLPISASYGMPQSLSMRIDQGVCYYIIFVLPRCEMSFCDFGQDSRLKRLPVMVMRCQTFSAPFKGKSVNAPSRSCAYHQFTGGYDCAEVFYITDEGKTIRYNNLCKLKR